MKRAVCLVFLVLFGCSAFAQIQHGTVGVIYFTKDKIVMAADSRGLSLGNAPPDDCICKIAAPDGQIVFLSSHGIGYKNQGPGDLVQSWASADEMRRAYTSVSLRFQDRRERIVQGAFEWGRLMVLNFQGLVLWHPEMVQEAARRGNGNLTRAIVGGFDGDGKPLLLQMTVPSSECFSKYQFCGSGGCKLSQLFLCHR